MVPEPTCLIHTLGSHALLPLKINRSAIIKTFRAISAGYYGLTGQGGKRREWGGEEQEDRSSIRAPVEPELWGGRHSAAASCCLVTAGSEARCAEVIKRQEAASVCGESSGGNAAFSTVLNDSVKTSLFSGSLSYCCHLCLKGPSALLPPSPPRHRKLRTFTGPEPRPPLLSAAAVAAGGGRRRKPHAQTAVERRNVTVKPNG